MGIKYLHNYYISINLQCNNTPKKQDIILAEADMQHVQRWRIPR